jgi:hypothetical protein
MIYPMKLLQPMLRRSEDLRGECVTDQVSLMFGNRFHLLLGTSSNSSSLLLISVLMSSSSNVANDDIKTEISRSDDEFELVPNKRWCRGTYKGPKAKEDIVD